MTSAFIKSSSLVLTNFGRLELAQDSDNTVFIHSANEFRKEISNAAFSNIKLKI